MSQEEMERMANDPYYWEQQQVYEEMMNQGYMQEDPSQAPAPEATPFGGGGSGTRP